MYGRSSKKFENGKLVKVEVSGDTHIEKVVLYGDFFLVPEDTLEKIEESLQGCPFTENFAEIIRTILEENRAQLVGCTISQLSQLITEAIERGHSSST